MPLSLLIALVIAFGIDLRVEDGPLRPDEAVRRLIDAGLGLGGLGLVAAAVGLYVAGRVARSGPEPGIRRGFYLASRAIDIANLGVYAWIIHALQWMRIVDWQFGLRATILADEAAVLAPFLLAQLVSWAGLYPAERALRLGRFDPSRRPGMVRYLVRRARQSWGLLMPAAIVYSIARDLMIRYAPELERDPYAQLASMALMGGFVLVMAPLFVRIAWPTRPLPPGPLRDRLERLASRMRFRCSDILVWQTGGSLVNAGVTGALPWFRYVLLTDALIECVDEREIEAVFGHEIGHIAHRHLAFFGFFFVASMGLMGLVYQSITYAMAGVRHGLLEAFGATWLEGYRLLRDDGLPAGLLLLGYLGLYFLIVFGFLSRRFERQADVFGCRAVSCGGADCPPHIDVNGSPLVLPGPDRLCPVGIRTFSNALTNVAELNGMELGARSWRHGSIRRRILFLEGLEGRPEAERQFQRGIGRLRIVLAVVLLAFLALAIGTGAIRDM